MYYMNSKSSTSLQWLTLGISVSFEVMFMSVNSHFTYIFAFHTDQELSDSEVRVTDTVM